MFRSRHVPGLFMGHSVRVDGARKLASMAQVPVIIDGSTKFVVIYKTNTCQKIFMQIALSFVQ